MTRKTSQLQHLCPTPVTGCDATLQCIEENVQGVADLIAPFLSPQIVDFTATDNPDGTATITAIFNDQSTTPVGVVDASTSDIQSFTKSGETVTILLKDGNSYPIDLSSLNESLTKLNDGLIRFNDGNNNYTDFYNGDISTETTPAPNIIERKPDGHYAPEKGDALLFLAKWDTENPWTAPIGWGYAQWEVTYDPFGLAILGQNFLNAGDFISAIGASGFPYIETKITWMDTVLRAGTNYGVGQFSEIRIRGDFVKTRSTSEAFTMSTLIPTNPGQSYQNTPIGFYMNNTSGVDFVSSAGNSNYRRYMAGAQIAVVASKNYNKTY